ncbi:MAG: hypothetical protein IPO92_15520 [Saprospiraceae bacterium]|nr:hypothetical protein [Saprospiraceae bacterium]
MIRSTVICLFILLTSCSDDAEYNLNNPKIKEALNKKRAAYENEILTICRNEVLNRASQYVDSVIAAEMYFHLSDSIVFPDKPIKPQSLGKIIVPDTIVARPIF